MEEDLSTGRIGGMRGVVVEDVSVLGGSEEGREDMSSSETSCDGSSVEVTESESSFEMSEEAEGGIEESSGGIIWTSGDAG